MPGGDEQLAAKVSDLLRTVLEEREHALDHVVGIRVHLVLWGERTVIVHFLVYVLYPRQLRFCHSHW